MTETKDIAPYPLPSLIECLECRFAEWERLHRLIKTGPVETGGNAIQGERYRFVAGRVRRSDDAPYGYTVYGECRQTGHFFSFDVDSEGAVANKGHGDPFKAQEFITWLKNTEGLKALQEALHTEAIASDEDEAMALATSA